LDGVPDSTDGFRGEAANWAGLVVEVSKEGLRGEAAAGAVSSDDLRGVSLYSVIVALVGVSLTSSDGFRGVPFEEEIPPNAGFWSSIFLSAWEAPNPLKTGLGGSAAAVNPKGVDVTGLAGEAPKDPKGGTAAALAAGAAGLAASVTLNGENPNDVVVEEPAAGAAGFSSVCFMGLAMNWLAVEGPAAGFPQVLLDPKIPEVAGALENSPVLVLSAAAGPVFIGLPPASASGFFFSKPKMP
jgi:hypothetical protein